MKLIIRKAEIDDIPKIEPLINACASPYKSLHYLRWWNFGTLIPTVTFCAIHEDFFVGMFMVYKRTLTNGLKCGVLMGLAVLESWRGKGLLKKLGQEAMNYFNDVDLFVCLPNQNGKKALEKHLSFKTISSVNTLVINSGKLNEPTQSYIRNQITTETKFDNFDEMRKQIFMFQCDKEFRQWRFSSHPRYSYQMIRMDNSDFIVVNLYRDEKSGIRYCDIVDFEFSVFDLEPLKSIINCTCSSFKKEVDQITIQAIPNTSLYHFIKEIGFYDSQIDHNLCLKVQHSKEAYLYTPENWLIKWSDYMR